MNEVTKIHLGRQAFTISVAAQKELRTYLDAITNQVDDADVADEVELRMAELLTERGINGDKVVLKTDIKYLKEQLGEPRDFKEDDESADSTADKPGDKRLFRDPKNAWIGGVAAGLAAYFGVDALLIRILFVIGTFAWGGSILVYILFWLLTPEARTSSDRLQMVGKVVTLGSLKEVVERDEVKEAGSRVREVVNTTFRLLVKAVGIALTLFGLMMLLGLVFGCIYLLVHGNVVADNLFPVGFKEHLLVYLAIFVAAMAAIFVILFGMAVFTRKWPIRSWLTGVLIGLTFIGFIAGGALAVDTVPKVRDRYNTHLHTVVRPLQPFTSVNAYGKNVTINFQSSSTYSVSLKYFNNANVAAITTTVNNSILTINSQNFNEQRCRHLCIPSTYDVTITVNSPNMPQLNIPEVPDVPAKPVFDPRFYNHY